MSMSIRYLLRRDTQANWLASTDIIPDGEWVYEEDTGLCKVGNGVDVYADLEYMRHLQPDAHAATHTDPGEDLLELADIAPQLVAALPASYGADNKFITRSDVDAVGGLITTAVQHVGGPLTPVHNTHYIVSGDTTLQEPNRTGIAVWKASLGVAAGVAITFPGTWKLTGSMNAAYPAMINLMCADGASIHAHVVSFITTAGVAVGTRVHVATWGNDSNNGLSWATAKRTIDAGATLARSLSVELWIGSGTYTASADMGFDLSGLTVYGGFDGTEISIAERTAAAPANGIGAYTYASETILMNRLSDRSTALYTISCSNYSYLNGLTFKDGVSLLAGHAMFINCKVQNYTNTSANGTINGCTLWYTTVSQCYANNGGGLYACIANYCYIYNCRSAATGGGMYNCIASNCVVERCVSVTSGGGAYAGVYNYCTFIQNEARTTGGGLAGTTAPLQCYANDTLIRECRSNQPGGGANTCYLTRCTIYGCYATSSNSYWGRAGGTAGGTSTDCLYLYNYAYEGGGGSQQTTAYRCIYIGNYITNGGNGGSGTAFFEATAYNCIFARNGFNGVSANVADTYSASYFLYNCTIIHNKSFTQNARTINCILWRNATESGTGDINTLQAADGIALASFVDPLDVVADVPAASQAAFDAKVLAHGYDLAAGAVAINAGDDSYNTSTLDARKRTRRVGVIDCGAYEYQAA